MDAEGEDLGNGNYSMKIVRDTDMQVCLLRCFDLDLMLVSK